MENIECILLDCGEVKCLELKGGGKRSHGFCVDLKVGSGLGAIVKSCAYFSGLAIKVFATL